MKKLFILIGCLTSLTVFGQQLGLRSTYMFNEAAYNPAAVGSKKYIPIYMSHRAQWVGFTGAPVSQVVTAHGDIGSGLGFGGSLYNESTGPSRTSGLSLMLSYRLRLTQNNKHGLRFGLGASFNQHVVDVSRLTTEQQNDQAIEKTYNNQFVPDADLGVFYTYEDKAFLGVSVKNVAQVKRSLFLYEDVLSNPLNRHYYAAGGYNFKLSETWKLKTTAIGRFIEAKTMQFEANVIADYNNRFFIGGGYRHKESVGGIIGMTISVVQFGYAYDFGISDIRQYGASSHEVFVQLQLQRKQGSQTSTSWKKRNRIYK